MFIYDTDFVNDKTCDKVLFILTEDTHSIKCQLNGWLKAMGNDATSERYLVINEDTSKREAVKDVDNVTISEGKLIRVKDANDQLKWSDTVLLFLFAMPSRTETVGFSLTVDVNQETLEAKQLVSNLRTIFNKINITENEIEITLKSKVNIIILLDATYALTEELKKQLLTAKLCGEINYMIFQKENKHSSTLAIYFNGQFCRHQSFKLLITCFHDLQLLKKLKL